LTTVGSRSNANEDMSIIAHGKSAYINAVQDTLVRYPLPPGGYFGRKVLVFSGLQRGSGCKIFITNELRLKYLLSTS
jgi:hypothetical protein